jgi:hypothetical protein
MVIPGPRKQSGSHVQLCTSGIQLITIKSRGHIQMLSC